MFAASIIPIVKASRVLSSAASIEVLWRLPPGKPVMPVEDLTISLSDSEPVRTLIDDASIIPLVFWSRIINRFASIVVSVIVNSSFPKSDISSEE